LVVLGRVRAGKAARLLRESLDALREHAELFLLGAGAEGMEFFGRADVHILLNYAYADLPALMRRLRPDAALMLADIPEPFSYTLSELQSLRVPVSATRLGALAERVQDGATGFLAAPRGEDVVAAVARLRNDRSLLEQARAALARLPVRGLSDMLADYREGLPASRGTSTPFVAEMTQDRLVAHTPPSELLRPST